MTQGFYLLISLFVYLIYFLVVGEHPCQQHEYFINCCSSTNLLYSWSWYQVNITVTLS